MIKKQTKKPHAKAPDIKRPTAKTSIQTMLEKGMINEDQYWVAEEFQRNWYFAFKDMGPCTLDLGKVRVDCGGKPYEMSYSQADAMRYIHDALRGKAKAEQFVMKEICGCDRSIRDLAKGNSDKRGFFKITLQYALDGEIKRWKKLQKTRKYLMMQAKKKWS